MFYSTTNFPVAVYLLQKKFLIVEIRLLEKSLEGHEIEIAQNGKSMLKKEYDLVFMDLSSN